MEKKDGTTAAGQQQSQSLANALAKGVRLCDGRYVIENVLGEGGYGITYEVTDTLSRSRLALKECYPNFALRRSPNGLDVISINPKAENAFAHIKKRFSEEAGLLVKLRPAKEIVNVYHSFLANNTAYYTMELLQGMDLQKYLRTYGTLDWSKMRPILFQLIRALYVTHQAGFIHRDISPDNIFVLNDDTIRLIDFGNARRYQLNQQLTAVVKEKFAPPEQYEQRRRQGPWTDVYSLCVTVYYAMTGTLPKKSTERKVEDNLAPLSKLVAIPEEVSRAVQTGMHPDENRRFQTVADLAFAMFPEQMVLSDLIPGQQSIQQSAKTHPLINQQSNQSNLHNRANTQQTVQPYGGGKNALLQCVQGTMQGFRMNLPLAKIQTIGRGDEQMDIAYPMNTPGISRNQCSFVFQKNGIIYVRDNNSSYGTFVNRMRLNPGKWYPLRRGDAISFGKEIYVVR